MCRWYPIIIVLYIIQTHSRKTVFYFRQISRMSHCFQLCPCIRIVRFVDNDINTFIRSGFYQKCRSGVILHSVDVVPIIHLVQHIAVEHIQTQPADSGLCRIDLFGIGCCSQHAEMHAHRNFRPRSCRRVTVSRFAFHRAGKAANRYKQQQQPIVFFLISHKCTYTY